MRRALHSSSTFAILLGALAATDLSRAQCVFRPPDIYSYARGVHEVYKGQDFGYTPTLRGVVWLDDGRVAAGYHGSSHFAEKGAIIRMTKVVRGEIDFEDAQIIQPPAEGRDSNIAFGTEIAASGDFIATTFYSVATESVPANSGAVAIYKKDEIGHYALDATVHSPEPGEGDGFGARLAMLGSWLAVLESTDSGAWEMRMFERDDSGWHLRQTLALPSSANGANVQAFALTMDGDRLAVGQDSDRRSSFTGRVYVWRRADGVWTLEKTLSGPSAGSRFGNSVDLSGDLLFVGASSDDRGAEDHGSVSEYRYESGDWKLRGLITMEEPVADMFLGVEVSYSEDGGYLGVGWLYGYQLFRRDGDGWKYLGNNGGGNAFYDWVSPPGAKPKDFVPSRLDTRPGPITQRGSRAIMEFYGRVSLIEYGTHRLRLRRVEPLEDCIWEPLGYYSNGAAGAEDSDGDGRSDLEEIYFGGLADSPILAAGVSISKISERAVEEDRSVSFRWLRAPGIEGLIHAEPEWSVNMIVWSGEGLVVEKIGEDPDTGQEIMEATLLDPPEGAPVYFRLRFELVGS